MSLRYLFLFWYSFSHFGSINILRTLFQGILDLTHEKTNGLPMKTNLWQKFHVYVFVHWNLNHFFCLIPENNIKAFFTKIFKGKSLPVKEPTASDKLHKSR